MDKKNTHSPNTSEGSSSAFDSMIQNPDDFTIDPQDFSDVAARSDSRRRWKIALVAIAAVGVLGMGAAFFVYASQTGTSSNVEIPTSNESSAPIEEVPELIINSPQPFMELYPEAPAAEPREIGVSLEEQTLVTTDGLRIALPGEEPKDAINQCTVTNGSDFCLAASAELNGSAYNVYLMKDVAHSRFFEKAEGFTGVELPEGSPIRAAGVMELPMSGVSVPVAAFTLQDSSGFMIALSEDKTTEDAQVLLETLQVEQG